MAKRQYTHRERLSGVELSRLMSDLEIGQLTTAALSLRYGITKRTVQKYRAAQSGTAEAKQPSARMLNAVDVHVPSLCFRAGCDRPRTKHRPVCDDHAEIAPPRLAPGLSMARIMGARA